MAKGESHAPSENSRPTSGKTSLRSSVDRSRCQRTETLWMLAQNCPQYGAAQPALPQPRRSLTCARKAWAPCARDGAGGDGTSATHSADAPQHSGLSWAAAPGSRRELPQAPSHQMPPTAVLRREKKQRWPSHSYTKHTPLFPIFSN